VLILSAGCSTKVTHFSADPDFAVADLRARGPAILGCASVPADSIDCLDLSNSLAIDLQNALRNHEHGLEALPFGEVRRALGDSLLRGHLESIRDYGALSPAELDSIAPLFGPSAGYLIVHRIERDRVSHHQSDVTETVDGKEVSTGRMKLYTVRKLLVTFSIYDLDGKHEVWTATIKTSEGASREVEGSAPSSNLLAGLLDAMFDATLGQLLGDDEEPEYPPPVALEVLLGNIYEEFADKLLEPA
jgi:hypothetical protein